jgi:hypothetical protein
MDSILKNQFDRLPLPGDSPAQTTVAHDNIRGADYFDSPLTARLSRGRRWQDRRRTAAVDPAPGVWDLTGRRGKCELSAELIVERGRLG